MRGENTTIRTILTQTSSPARGTLLEWLASRINNAMLKTIAAADYGNDANEHYAALQQIRDTLQIQNCLQWIPREVLELTRWSIIEPTNSSTQQIYGNKHLMRAFACTILLLANSDPNCIEYNMLGGDTATVIQLIDSVIVLGPEAITLTLQLLTWRIFSGVPLDAEESPFFALAILLLTLAQPQPLLTGAELNQLAEWVMVEEAQARQELQNYLQTGDLSHWLLNLTDYRKQKEVLLQIARRLILEPSKPHPREATESLTLIGNALTWK